MSFAVTVARRGKGVYCFVDREPIKRLATPCRPLLPEIRYHQGQFNQRREAAVIAEMAPSISTHRMAGRQSAEDYGKTRRLLTAEEELILLWRCKILQCSGWLQAPADVRALALEIVQKRDPNAKVDKDWIRNSLYKCHPEIKSQWSQQLDRIRALRGSKGNYQAIKLFF